MIDIRDWADRQLALTGIAIQECEARTGKPGDYQFLEIDLRDDLYMLEFLYGRRTAFNDLIAALDSGE